MKIWQAFASNHSSDYTIVGQFQDKARAKVAAKKIKKVINDIWKLDEKRQASIHTKWNAAKKKWENVSKKKFTEKDVREMQRLIPEEMEYWTKPYTENMNMNAVVDWESKPKVEIDDNEVVISVYTAGYGVDGLVRWLKNFGAKKAKGYG